MIKALLLSLSQFSDPKVRTVLVRSLALSCLLFAGIFTALWFLIKGADPCAMVGLESCRLGYASTSLALLPFGLIGLWLLFPAVAIFVISLFSDEIVDAVEDRYYPSAKALHNIGWGQAFKLALGSAGRLLLWNLIAIPAYLMLMFTAIGPFILFMAVNAIALGRDLGDMVAVRHLNDNERMAWLHSTRLTRSAMGAIVSLAFLVPVFNLFAPLLGASMATHIFHQRRD